MRYPLTLFLFLALLSISSVLKGQGYTTYFTSLDSTERAIVDYRHKIQRLLKEDSISRIHVRANTLPLPTPPQFLSFDEEEALLLISSKYDTLLSALEVRNTRYSKAHRLRILRNKKLNTPIPQYGPIFSAIHGDSLFLSIGTYLRHNRARIIADIESTNLPPDEKAFIKLFLEYSLLLTDFCNLRQEEQVVDQARTFLTHFSHSNWSKFVNTYMFHKYKEGNWGLGMHFNSGLLMYSGTLQSYFKPGTLIYCSVDLNFRRLDLTVGMGGTLPAGIKQDFVYDTIWQEGHQHFTGPVMAATLGYHVLESRRLNISPFIGARYIGFSGKAENDSLYYKNTGWDSKNPWTIGVHLDYKFGHPNCTSCNYKWRGWDKQKSFGVLRLSVSYQNPDFREILPVFSGGIWLITLGFGFNAYGVRHAKAN